MPIWIIAPLHKVGETSAKHLSQFGGSAFGLRYFWETYINNLIAPEKVQFVLTRSPQEWYNHTRDIYRCYVQDQTFLWLARLQTVSNTASSKRLHYVWTILHKVGGTSATRSSQLGDFAFGLHYFSHPMPALYCFVIMWLRHTQHGVGCLAQCHERTRLTVTDGTKG